MAWLDDWANRLELTIDGDRVDGDMVNFPVLITLTSGSGRNNYDATSVFDELLEVNYSSDGFNPDDAAAGITVTSGSLVAYRTSGGWAAVRSVDSRSTGRVYFEVACDVMAGTRFMIGIGTSSELLTYPGNTSEGWGYHSHDAGKYHGGFTAYGNTYAQGDVIGVAINLNNGKIWWSKNGVWQDSGDPVNDSNPAYSDVTGPIYAMVGLYDNTDKVSLNLGTSAFQYTIPDGFESFNKEYVDNTQKIAVTDFTGINQLPVEISFWNWQDESAHLWTKVPTLTSGTDATLYLYYDADQLDNDLYVGDTGSLAASNVWSNSYVAVYHMSQSPVDIEDSKGFNDAASIGGSLGAGDLVDAVPGKGINFNGSSDYIDVGTHSSLNVTNLSVEAMINPGSVTGSHTIFHKGNTAVAGHRGWWVSLDGDELYVQTWDGGWKSHTSNNANLSTFTDYFTGITLTTGASPCRMFKNDIELTGPAATSLGYIDDSDYAAYIGNLYQGTPSTWFDGTISELRISDTIRSPAWMKATYYSSFDNFMTFAAGGTPPPPAPPEPDWWDSWANRLEITVDKDRIDENLAYFPVLITLSSGTGINNFDNTDVFDHLTVNSGVDSYTSLMLPTDGDRSSSQHPITFGYEPHITTVSGISCVSLNGTNQVVLAFASDDWDLGLEDFTLEAYINADNFSSVHRIMSHGSVNNNNGSWSWGIGYHVTWGTGTRFGFNYRSGGVIYTINSDELTSYISTSTWHRVAVTRSGNTLYLFLDGVLRGTGAITHDLTNTGTGEEGWLFLAARREVASRIEHFPGYMTQWAIHKGEAKWTSNFTPSEFPVKTAYTKFLYNCEGEGSQYNHNLYMISDPEIHTVNPAVGGHGYWSFDADPGPDDAIEVYDHSSLDFGSGDFTIEFWFYTIDYSGIRGLFARRGNGDGRWVAVQHRNTGVIKTLISNSSGSWAFNQDTGVVPAGEWVHYAVTRENDTIRVYLNGFLHISGSFTGSVYEDGAPLTIGSAYSGGAGYEGHYGYIQGFKISKGIARYTGNFFSPPNPPEGDSWINRKKIQLADAEHNRLYTEIEQWDHANGKAKLWTKAPVLTSDTDTTLYLYYDNTQLDNTIYVGDVGDPTAEKVWTGNNFTAVYHMAILNELTLSNFLDSTPNNNVGDFNNMDVFDFTDGQVSRALDFTRAGSEYIGVPNDAAFDLTSNYTVEVVYRPTAADTVNELINKTPSDVGGFQLRGDSGNGPNFYTGTGTVSGPAGWTAYGWQYAACVLSGTTLPILYMDGYFYDSGSSTGTPSNSNAFFIGRRWDSHYFNGDIDEVRVSDVPRSPAWVKANYYNMWHDLLSYAEDSRAVATCSGTTYVNDVPWSGLPVRLYRRSTGELIGTATTVSGGHFEIDTPYDEDHYIISMYVTDSTNALIFDWINPHE